MESDVGGALRRQIHRVWPALMARVDDADPGVARAAVAVVGEFLREAGDFMAARFREPPPPPGCPRRRR